MCSLGGLRSVIITVEVVVPLALALDGGAAIFSRAVMFELNPEVGGGEGCCWVMAHRRCARYHRGA
jgi:hypothetical protein